MLSMFFPRTPLVYAQGVDLKTEPVAYTLPFPGLLPDNPLYALKVFRDHIWLFLTRDNMKKAELLLLFSDKKTSAAQALTKKGAWDKGAEMMLEAEQDFKKMTGVVTLSQQAGVSPESAFIMNVVLSNKKHREVIEDLLSTIPQGPQKTLEEALKLNDELVLTLEALSHLP